MNTTAPVFQGEDLRSVLAEAREYVLQHGNRRATARGETCSLGGVQLTWTQPTDDGERAYWGWNRESTEWYYQNFVAKRPENLPERLASPGDLLFPYKYAARSRFWDGGWGYALAVLQVTRDLGTRPATILGEEPSFRRYLEEAGERVHVQTLLAVWDWLGPDLMAYGLADDRTARSLAGGSRSDQLGCVIREIEISPGSRRAVTGSFVYPNLDHRFDGILGIPPYQVFQLLPGRGDEPLNSLHLHRSLDASDGVQLDFYHDLRWLQEACRQLGRQAGTISVVAADFHVYLGPNSPHDRAGVAEWLVKVTDGYPAGQGQVGDLLKEEWYSRNIPIIYRRLGGA